MRRSRLRSLILGVSAALMVAAAFALGVTSELLLRPNVPIPEDVAAPKNFALFGEVWQQVDREFYGDRPAQEAITRGAIEGLVAAMDDPWAMLAPTDIEEPNWLSPRRLDALGLWLVPVAQGARVLAVTPDGVADEAGMQAGDLIVGASPTEELLGLGEAEDTATDAEAGDTDDDGEDAAIAAGSALGASLLGATDADDIVPVIDLLSDADEPMTLVLLRGGRAALQVEMTPSPDAPRPPAYEVEDVDDVTRLVKLAVIDEVAIEGLGAALARPAGSGGALEGFVLDLRNNPGGDEESAARLAGYFVEGTTWLVLEGDGTTREREAIEAGSATEAIDADTKLIVLVNGGTVGEAEMLAGALRDRAGAVLVGDATFGRNTLTAVQRLSDGGLLRVSHSAWALPNGDSVVETGLEPERPVAGRDEQRAEALAAAAGEAFEADAGAEASGG